MKKLLLSALLLSFFYGATQAQSFIRNPTEDTVLVAGTINDFLMDAGILIINQSPNSKYAMCYRTSTNLAPGHKTHFCWWQTCYGDSTTLSTTAVPMMSGDTTNSFHGDLAPNYHVGISYVSYCFFDSINYNDQTCVTFKYTIDTVLSIGETNSTPTMSLPQPNPSHKMASISYSLKNDAKQFQFEVYNLTGSKIATYKPANPTGVLIIPTEQLPSGIYFCILKQNSKSVVTQKLVVVHP